MGKINGPYREDFAKGSMVKIADQGYLEDFLKTWNLHNKLSADQLQFAGQVAQVDSVGFYHGGDELYTLKGIPGTWHECCLRRVPETHT